jgi:hypothetical protein
MIKKVKGGYAVAHCHGKKKGKVIKKHATKEKAAAQHTAIRLNQRNYGNK